MKVSSLVIFGNVRDMVNMGKDIWGRREKIIGYPNAICMSTVKV